MAFAMHDAPQDTDTEVMNEINMTPLVDVMLVLLIVFIITVPVMKHAIPVDLPQASNQPQHAKPDRVQLSIDAQGASFWNQDPVDPPALTALLRRAAAQQPQPELHIRADKAVRYEFVAQAMSQAREAGLHRIGFVTEPRR